MKTRIAKGILVSTYQSKMRNKAQEKKQAKEENTLESLKNNNKNKKEVLISVYVESSSMQGRRKVDDQTRQLSISKHSQTSNPRSYDRRAQLLAYAQELRRNPDAKRPQPPKNDAMPVPKENPKNPLEPKYGAKRTTSDEKSQTRVRRGKRYQRLVPQVDISCRPKSIILRKKKNNIAKKLADFRFMAKLRMMLRGLCRT